MFLSIKLGTVTLLFFATKTVIFVFPFIFVPGLTEKFIISFSVIFSLFLYSILYLILFFFAQVSNSFSLVKFGRVSVPFDMYKIILSFSLSLSPFLILAFINNPFFFYHHIHLLIQRLNCFLISNQ